MSVKVTKAGHKRKGETGIIESFNDEAGTVEVKFDTPDPDGEVVTIKADDLAALPGQ